MSTAATIPDQADLIRRAFVNLKSVRSNLQSGYVTEKGLYSMYGKALDELQRAGFDVTEWRLPHNAAGNLDASEICCAC